MDVQGTVADGFEPVRDAFAANFSDRGDTGAALTVHREGRIVVDLWGGEGRRADTAAVLRSASKGPAAAVLHLLHQRGQLDLDAPVATYWPEFKANGKERLLVRHLLAHRGGLPVPETPLTPAQAYDGVTGPAVLAAQAPAWEPGTDHGYHPHTFSWLLGELVLRATGRTLGRWFAQHVAGPLDLDLRFGLPMPTPADEGRLAPLVRVPTPSPPVPGGMRMRPKRAVTEAYADPDSFTRRAFGAIDPAPDENDPAYLASGLPGSSAVATARSLSRFYAALIGPLPDIAGTVTGTRAGTVTGTRTGAGAGTGNRLNRLFTPATLTQARSQESSGPDRVLVVNSRFGLGFMLHGPAAPMLSAGSFGHPGRGGSLAFADPESGTAFAYVTSAMQRSVTSDPRAHALVRALRAAVNSEAGPRRRYLV